MSKAKTYIIPAGKHSAKNRLPGLFCGGTMAFNVTFDRSAAFEFKDPQNALDVSKVYGISESLNPHYNSARFGFAFVDGKLRLYAYVYCKGTRTIEEICTIKTGVTYKCFLRLDVLTNDKYFFGVKDYETGNMAGYKALSRGKSTEKMFGYKLFPYVGGDEVVDHDVIIIVQPI